MKDEHFKIVSGKRRQHSLNLGDVKLKQMRVKKRGFWNWLLSWFRPSKERAGKDP